MGQRHSGKSHRLWGLLQRDLAASRSEPKRRLGPQTHRGRSPRPCTQELGPPFHRAFKPRWGCVEKGQVSPTPVQRVCLSPRQAAATALGRRGTSGLAQCLPVGPAAWEYSPLPQPRSALLPLLPMGVGGVQLKILPDERNSWPGGGCTVSQWPFQ